MGCDIHMYAEYRRMSNPVTVWSNHGKVEHPAKPIWVKIENFFLNQYYDPTDSSLTDWNYRSPLTDQPWHDRNYLLFSVLAGVRNYWELKPIAEPKGLPEDADKDTIEALENSADHSHSFLTLEELSKFKWTEPFEVKDEERKQWATLAEFQIVIDQLWRICSGLKIEKSDIRIVFGFDN